MDNKGRYSSFCEQVYVPIYSKPWWLDAICGEDNWDVFVLEKGGTICAALPYYLEKKEVYRITKPPLTQNNGLIIKYPKDEQSISKRQAYEEKIIDELIPEIEALGLDIYEQQFHYSFKNFLPFFWHFYDIIPRFTYIIFDTSDLDKVFSNISSKYKNMIRKGAKNVHHYGTLSPERFYEEHKKIFDRQGMRVPFSEQQFERVYNVTKENGSGKVIAAFDENDTVLSLAFYVWDERSVYLDAGGPVPEYASLQTFDALVFEGIKMANQMGKSFDFEGSVVKQINHSFREYGGMPIEYYRIRKVFNKDIIFAEAQTKIDRTSERT